MDEPDPDQKGPGSPPELTPLLGDSRPLLQGTQSKQLDQYSYSAYAERPLGNLKTFGLCCGVTAYLGPDWVTLLVGHVVTLTLAALGCWFTLTSGFPLAVPILALITSSLLILSLVLVSWSNPGEWAATYALSRRRTCSGSHQRSHACRARAHVSHVWACAGGAGRACVPLHHLRCVYSRVPPSLSLDRKGASSPSAGLTLAVCWQGELCVFLAVCRAGWRLVVWDRSECWQGLSLGTFFVALLVAHSVS
eukprot:TRINITY_DN775_c0_g1_i3.p1 TRINITY_DN775_c0_g1~~TRINITY_DN775_c0_g1_i3.p1  ORF type:complete len:250 (+),score=4.25 TRINITY_DN775_c0_g1_i3:208-957(+)